MNNSEVKHSVLMISYNQENLISIALDSILSQEPLPYEIIISDDASIDKTWEIIQSYQIKYPSIIKAQRNETNLGVYGNFNKVLKSATGDVVSWLSGDDYYNEGLFAEFNNIISENNVDFKEDKFVIVTNFELSLPNGKSIIYNNYQLRELNIFKQRVRYGIFYRMIGISRKILDEIELTRTDVGIHADWLLDLDIENNCDKYYFTPFVSSTYRAGVGIVSQTKSREMYASRLIVIDLIKEKYAGKLESDDLSFLDYEIDLNNYLISDNFSSYFKHWKSYLRNIDNFPINNPKFSKERLLTLLPPKCRNILKRFRLYMYKILQNKDKN